MITAIVIISSIVLATAFGCAWAFRPSFRRQIEHPKYWFQEQVRAYDRHCEVNRE